MVTTLEVGAILLYVRINKRIASNCKNRKAADAVILPIYHRPWSILIIFLGLLLISDASVVYLTYIDFKHVYVAFAFVCLLVCFLCCFVPSILAQNKNKTAKNRQKTKKQNRLQQSNPIYIKNK